MCPQCAGNLFDAIREKRFYYCDSAEIVVYIPVSVCENCRWACYGEEAERIIMEAIEQHRQEIA